MPCVKSNKSSKHEAESIEKELSNRGEILQAVFHHYGNFLLKIPTQICICILTLAIFAVSCWGNVELKQEFDPMWFLPKDSYLFQWHVMNEK